MLKNLMKLLNSYLDMGIPGYDVMVCQKGECVWWHQAGYSDLEKRIPK